MVPRSTQNDWSKTVISSGKKTGKKGKFEKVAVDTAQYNKQIENNKTENINFCI